MGAVKGRRPRQSGLSTVHIQALVAPERVARVRATADALGVSLSHYIDALLEREQATALDEHGRPVWWQEPVPDEQEVLPLTETT